MGNSKKCLKLLIPPCLRGLVVTAGHGSRVKKTTLVSLPLEIVLPAYPLVDMYNMQHGGWRRLSRQRNIYSLWRHRRSCAVAQETHSHIETTICNVPAMAPMAVTDSDICAPLSPYHIPTCKKPAYYHGMQGAGAKHK